MVDDPGETLQRQRRVSLIVLVVGVLIFAAGIVSGQDAVEIAGLVVLLIAVAIAGSVLLRASRANRS